MAFKLRKREEIQILSLYVMLHGGLLCFCIYQLRIALKILDNTDNHNNAEEKNHRGITHDEVANFDSTNQHQGVSIMKPPANRGIPGGGKAREIITICLWYCRDV